MSSSRRLQEDVLQTRLEDVLEDILEDKICYAKGVLSTSLPRRMFPGL